MTAGNALDITNADYQRMHIIDKNTDHSNVNPSPPITEGRLLEKNLYDRHAQN